jgi:site-specific DNA-methyltransferase (adenine-specific)
MRPYYQDESVTLYHGDCREVLPFVGRFDLLLTDPPYGISFAAQPTLWQRRKGQKPESWDADTPPSWLIAMAQSACDAHVIWGGNYLTLPPSRCWLSWFKPDAPPSMGNVEYAWTNLDQNSRQIEASISATNAERVGHPTQKPEKVMLWSIGQAAGTGSVLDPFAGSGTTLVASKRLGLKAIGIEREERYCEIAARRLSQGALTAMFTDEVA